MIKNIKKISSIVIASHNPGKIREMLPFIKKLNTKIYFAKDFKLKEPKEDGSNFVENALKKSRYVNNKTKKVSIADDSGLVIPSLQGKPGIFSARWAGEKKDFNRAMKKVNNLLYKKKTNAYYISVLAISWNKKKEEIFNIYHEPKSIITLEKAGKWTVVQLVKAFLGMPIIPGR